MAVYQIHREQKIPAHLNEVWDFVSSPGNLKLITPEHMGFDITSDNLPEKIHAGMIISYKVTPLLNMTWNWITEITHFVEKEYFVDEQRVGPFKIWHHQHIIVPQQDGVLMADLVTYQPPLGIFGALANRIIIRRKLDEIFDFRRRMLIQIFGEIR